MVCKILLLFKHHPSYNSGSRVFPKGPPLLLELGSPYPICCASPTNAEVVLACYILRSKVFIRVEKTKLPPHGLLFILFSILTPSKRCCLSLAVVGAVLPMSLGLPWRKEKECKMWPLGSWRVLNTDGWIKIVSLSFSQNKLTVRVGEGGRRQIAIWKADECAYLILPHSQMCCCYLHPITDLGSAVTSLWFWEGGTSRPCFSVPPWRCRACLLLSVSQLAGPLVFFMQKSGFLSPFRWPTLGSLKAQWSSPAAAALPLGNVAGWWSWADKTAAALPKPTGGGWFWRCRPPSFAPLYLVACFSVFAVA